MAIIGQIPAAGKGTRLHPLPFSKELYPIGYQNVEIDGEEKLRPKVVSQYLLNHMVSAGAEKIIVTLGPGKYDIMDYYGAGERFNVDIMYNFQSQASGMPFALDLSFKWLKEEDIVIFGMSDTIIEPQNSFKALKKDHEKLQADLVLGLFRTENPSKFGMVNMDSKTQRVIETIDKPKKSDLAYMWGCCIWNYAFAEHMHKELIDLGVSKGGKEVVFGDIINSAIKKGLKVFGSPVDNGRYIDIGTIEDLDTALKLFHL